MDLGVKLVRLALLRLAENPPLALGDTDLARLLIPHEADRLVRGQLLQHALKQSIAALPPDGPQDASDSRWRQYLVCFGEYEAGQRRATLMRTLAIANTTYTRAKRRGVERIAALLPYILADMVHARKREVGGHE